MLDEVPYVLVEQLNKFARARQLEKSPFSRSDTVCNEILKKHALWLEEQDIPETIIRTPSKGPLKKERSATKLSPEMSAKRALQKAGLKASTNSTGADASFGIGPRRPPSPGDMFTMDEPESPSHPATSKTSAPPTSPPIWKPTSIPRYVFTLIIFHSIHVWSL